jgi:hypothetical protein
MNYQLRKLDRSFKLFLLAFLLILNIGYFTGLTFVRQTESDYPGGIVENYNGNEDVEEIQIMKFKKGKREMLTIIHTHILSIGFIFLCLGVLVWGTGLSVGWKLFITIEPFCSIILTFGGIYLIWLEYTFMSYIVMFSGILMTLNFILGTFFVTKALISSASENL